MSIDQPYERQFGFLADPIAGDFTGGIIVPLDDHADRCKRFEEQSHRDGYYYPPGIATYKVDSRNHERKEKVARSGRPAYSYRLNASHRLRLESPLDTSNTTCSDHALIIYVLAYLHGTRLQFVDWYFDGRVPNKPRNDISSDKQTRLDFIGYVYRWWQTQPPIIRNRLNNILYVLTRARSLELVWDAFTHHYMVFDAIYKLYVTLNPSEPKAGTHRERFDLLLSKFGMSTNNDLVNKLYKARNELFHEAMWSGSTIGFGSSDRYAYHYPLYLSDLNSRLICGIVGYRNDYLKSEWWGMSTCSFGLLRGS